MRGGKNAACWSTRAISARSKYKVIARFTGQNGKKANQRPKLRTPCKKHKQGKGKAKP